MIGLAGVAGALAGNGPVPRWVLRLFAAWCIATPYWWYLEHRLFLPAEAAARQAFAAGQAHSRWVWLRASNETGFRAFCVDGQAPAPRRPLGSDRGSAAA
jgi:hypothetical protein